MRNRVKKFGERQNWAKNGQKRSKIAIFSQKFEIESQILKIEKTSSKSELTSCSYTY